MDEYFLDLIKQILERVLLRWAMEKFGQIFGRFFLSKETGGNLIIFGFLLLAFVLSLGHRIEEMTRNGWNERSLLGVFLVDGWALFLALSCIIWGAYRVLVSRRG